MADAIKRDVPTCPDAETIAAFIDGRLNGVERARVVEHLAECPDCYFVFSESARMPASTEATRTGTGDRRFVFKRAFRALTQPRVLAGLAAAAAIVIAIRVIPWRASSTSEMQALVAAVGTERTFEPRLTGGFAYGPVKATRGAATEPSLYVRIAAANIEKTATEHRTPATLAALGVAHVVTGKPADAVTALKSATRDAPGDAGYWSDLAAAYLASARDTGALDDLVNALNAADRATRLDPGRQEAWFNRALAIEQIPAMREDAKAAWDDYLKVDAASPWADEAKQHVARLGQR